MTDKFGCPNNNLQARGFKHFNLRSSLILTTHGSLAVRYGERYLPLHPCVPAEKRRPDPTAKLWGNILQSPRRGTASRRPAPIRGSRARREERALPIVPMSSGRLSSIGLVATRARLRFTGTG